jgi:hypothetical protein
MGPDGPVGTGAESRVTVPQFTATPVTRRSRGRWRTAILVVALAALVGGGAGLAAMKYGDNSGTDSAGSGSLHGSSTSPRPSAEASKSAPSTAVVPDGWHRVDDPEGFSLLVPDGWKRRADGQNVDYTPDDGNHYIRISVDPEPDFENSYMHMLNMETRLTDRLPGYERKTLHSNTYRDRPGSLWDFTWTESKDHPGPRHAIDQMYYEEEGGPEYALYMTGPADDWDTTRDRFDTMLRGWRAPAGTG